MYRGQIFYAGSCFAAKNLLKNKVNDKPKKQRNTITLNISSIGVLQLYEVIATPINIVNIITI
jgi:hypothetical protein